MHRPLGLALVLSAVGVALPACSSRSSSPIAPQGSPDAGEQDVAVAEDAAPETSLADPPIPPKYAPLAAAIEDERKAFQAPGVAVALMEHGQLTFFHGFGTKGPGATEAVDARTLFRIGSMTKALTATAMLQLVAAGKVDLDATLLSVVPDVGIDDPTNLPSLTVGQCLSHQSGLYDYLVIDTTGDDAALSEFLTGSQFGAVEYFMDPPGTFYNYSNPNFMLAGLAVERAGGVPYRQALHDGVFSALGMTRTFFLPSEAIADGDFTDGTSTDSKGNPWDVKPDSYDNAWARPAGYAFSSVLDYQKFVQFLYAGNAAVLADAQRQAMQTRQVDMLEDGDLEGYGYALEIDEGFFLGNDFYSTNLVTHDGAIPGFASEFYMVPSTGFAFIAFANADGAYLADSVLLAMESFAGLPATSTPPDLNVNPATLPKIAGAYYDPHTVGHVTVAVTSGELQITMPDLDAAGVPYGTSLTPLAPNSFELVIQGQPVEATFLTDATDAYAWMRTRPFVAARQAGPPMMHRPVDAEALRERLRLTRKAPSLTHPRAARR